VLRPNKILFERDVTAFRLHPFRVSHFKQAPTFKDISLSI